MIPNLDTPTVVTLPDGRKARIVVELLEGPWPERTPLAMAPSPAVALPAVTKETKRRAALIPAAPRNSPGQPWLDHPLVGGRITCFVLCYGDYFDLHRRCLDALLTTAGARLEVRVYANACGPASLAFLECLAREGRVAKLYQSPENGGKYRRMREMFHDPATPVTTPWLLWLDDDTITDRDPDWLEKLAEATATGVERDPKVGMVGVKQFIQVGPKQARWVREGSWYRGKNLQDKHGREAPNGNCVHFVSGSFWLARSEMIAECDLPDPRLDHQFGDVALGAQAWQCGYTLKNVDSKAKLLVRWSSVPRRGRSDKTFWVP